MNNLSMRKLFVILFLLLLAIGSGDAQIFHKNPEKELLGKSLGKKKEVKAKEPRSVLKAKRKQEANDRKLKKNYEKSIKRSQKRTIDIQTPEVQARMKQNKKDSAVRDKTKRKKMKSGIKRAGKKYK
jgi:LAS superfamily LD-carboxypeptidase LdcB